MTAITTSHILLDDRGRAFIDGTPTRVAMIVMDKRNGLTPDQIHAAYPYLSLAKVYAALAYYYDHQPEIDAEIARDLAESQSLRREATARGNQPTAAELRARLNRRPDPA